MTTPTINNDNLPADDALAPRRVRHELRFRVLTVQQVQRVTPHLLRITLAGDELEGFHSPGFDDHVKLFLPDAATGALRLPQATPDGMVWPEGAKPVMRDYTPGAHDAAARTLQLDFALHDAGPATQWALQAAPGQQVGLGGPRGSFILPTGFDVHLLVGDDTALPAIARRLAELPAAARAIVVAEVDSAADHVPLASAATLDVHWVHRQAGAAPADALLARAVAALHLPPGETHAWVAAESASAKAVRHHLVKERGLAPRRVKASGYWRRGSAGTHDTHED
ncbi:MAG: siderophore-interacting protein [Burkholderiales bacterium]|nr:siderophore-interacting protein [Burkholderiales bacterium]